MPSILRCMMISRVCQFEKKGILEFMRLRIITRITGGSKAQCMWREQTNVYYGKNPQRARTPGAQEYPSLKPKETEHAPDKSYDYE